MDNAGHRKGSIEWLVEWLLSSVERLSPNESTSDGEAVDESKQWVIESEDNVEIMDAIEW
jgi:hypothetical protein